MITKEQRTKRTQMGIVVLWAGVAAAYPAATAHAGDPHKMRSPQLAEPDGGDVNATTLNVSAGYDPCIAWAADETLAGFFSPQCQNGCPEATLADDIQLEPGRPHLLLSYQVYTQARNLGAMGGLCTNEPVGTPYSVHTDLWYVAPVTCPSCGDCSNIHLTARPDQIIDGASCDCNDVGVVMGPAGGADICLCEPNGGMCTEIILPYGTEDTCFVDFFVGVVPGNSGSGVSLADVHQFVGGPALDVPPFLPSGLLFFEDCVGGAPQRTFTPGRFGPPPPFSDARGVLICTCCKWDTDCAKCETCDTFTATCVPIPGCCDDDADCPAKCEDCDLTSNTCFQIPGCCAGPTDCPAKCEICDTGTNLCVPDPLPCCVTDADCDMCETCDLINNVCVPDDCNAVCSSPSLSQIFLAEINDSFAGPPVPGVPGTALANYQVLHPCSSGLKGFDDLSIDTCFGHTITGLLQPRIIVGASLEIRLKAASSGAECNDAIGLQATGGSPSLAWSRRIGTGGPFAWCAGDPGILPGPWTNGRESTLVLDLCDLPNVDGSFTDIIGSLNDTGRLDVRVADDTGVDYMTLTVCYCSCPGGDDCNNNGISDVCETTTFRNFCVKCDLPSSQYDCSDGTKWSFLLNWLGGAKDFWNLNCPRVWPTAGTTEVHMAAGLIACINDEVCPSITAEAFGLGKCFRVTVPGTVKPDLCVGPAGAMANCCLPGASLCTFNPTLIEVSLSGNDCNGNGEDDAIDVALETSRDLDHNGIPDECEGPVPTMSEWGLIVLTLLLVAGIVIRFGRRRAAKGS